MFPRRALFKSLQRNRARLRLSRKVTGKRKPLALQARGHQGQEQGAWANVGHDRDTGLVRCCHQLGPGVGHCRAARLADQAGIAARKQRCDQRWNCRKRRVFIEFADLDGLQWPLQWQALEKRAGGLCVFSDQIIETRGERDERRWQLGTRVTAPDGHGD